MATQDLHCGFQEFNDNISTLLTQFNMKICCSQAMLFPGSVIFTKFRQKHEPETRKFPNTWHNIRKHCKKHHQSYQNCFEEYLKTNWNYRWRDSWNQIKVNISWYFHDLKLKDPLHLFSLIRFCAISLKFNRKIRQYVKLIDNSIWNLHGTLCRRIPVGDEGNIYQRKRELVWFSSGKSTLKPVNSLL